ncbi:MAG: hypothetical protein ACJAY8_000370 [Sphingobacteriales bacterium]|jgi:hypothetical protein
MRKLILIFTLFISGLLSAQTDPLNQQIITVGDRSIQLRDAFKISEYPSIFDTVQNAPNISYFPLNFDAELNYEVQPIQAAKLRIVEPLTKLNRFYLKAGVGNYLSPLGEITFNALRDRSNSYGFNGRYHSSRGGIQDVVNSSFSDIEFKPWYRNIGRKVRFDIQPYYSKNTLHQYGYLNAEVDTVPTADGIYQAYQFYGGQVRLKSFYKDSTKVNYDLNLGTRLMDDQFGAKELNVKGSLLLSALYGKEYYQLLTSADVNAYNTEGVDTLGVTKNSTIIRFSPSVQSTGEKFKVKIGIGVFADASDPTKFFFLPDVSASLNVLDGVMSPYVRLTGNVERQNFFSTTRTNPFVNSRLDIRNEHNKFIAEVGIRGGISERVSYHIGGFLKKRDQAAFFVADSTDLVRNKFDLIYDDMEAAGGQLELKYQNGEKLKILTGFTYTKFTTEKEAQAWYMPSMRGDLDVFYDIQDKFTVKMGVDFIGERFAKVLDLSTLGYTVKSLDPITDINLGLEYRYTRKISAFMDVNNILGKRYLLFDQYPAMGINIMAGFTISFL